MRGSKRFWKCLQRSCKLQKVFRSTCSIPANSRKFFEAFAAFLQTPKSFSRPLQRSCKLQKVFRGTCNSVANARKFFVGLVTVLQTPESFLWDLQQCCKRQKVFCGTCNGVASVSKNTLTVIARYPRHSPEIRNLILSSNTRSIRTPDFKEASARKSFLLLLRAQGPQGLYVFIKREKKCSCR